MIDTQLAVRVARQSDQAQIANLLYFEPYVHRHLDWRGPLEWLGVPEYWVVEQSGMVVSALASPIDPEGVAWLRLFANVSTVPLDVSWKMLWETVQTTLRGRELIVGAITTSEWFSALLAETGFTGKQQIVVLEQRALPFRQQLVPEGVSFRPMTETDLPAVTRVDAAGFAPLWRNSQAALHSGFIQAGFATVALFNGEVVGYQISTRNAFGAHLARLAVLPKLQGRGIGYALVQELLNDTRRAGLFRLTVNTQNDNHSSLALYQKIGFELTGEQYTVFTHEL